MTNEIKRADLVSRRYQRRNFFLGLANGAIFSMAEVFIGPDMVLTWFLTQLHASNFMIGLISPVRYGGWFLPQIFISGYMQRLPLKLFFYRWMSIVRSAALLALTLMVAFVPIKWMLPLFFVLLATYSVSAGLCGISFMDVVSKVIPPTRRGAFFGWRMFIGGILTLGASSLVGVILDEPDGLYFPRNFTVLFGAAFVLISISMAAWCLVNEPAGVVDPVRTHWTGQVKRGIRLIQDNTPYRVFVLARLALMLAQLAAPFYIVYAKMVLNIPARMVGVYLTARTATAIAFNLVWGRVSDRKGNRTLIQITNAIGLSMPVLALTIGGLARCYPQSVSWLTYVYMAVFVASGAFGAGSGIGNMNYLLDIAPPEQRSLYLGFTNTLFGIGFFTSALSGMIVDWIGFTALLVIAAFFYGLAWLFSMRMVETRKTHCHHGK